MDGGVFVDRVGWQVPRVPLWPSVVVRRAQIEAEVERLGSVQAPADGRRRSLISHPLAVEPGLGLAPGVRVSLDVLLPGESTAPIRHNSNEVNFCIRGGGRSEIDGTSIGFGQYDVWCTPSLAHYVHVNDTDEVQVRLTYSNAALLEKLNVHYVEQDPSPPQLGGGPREPDQEDVPGDFDDEIELGGGALLTSYERLINPPVVEQLALHWPWGQVKPYLDKLTALDEHYQGRRLYLLYNPATGRGNGTTNSFFATMCVRPPHIVDVPHRHTAAAINYYFSGSGYSVVGGRRVEWEAGDLMLSAPGWAVHNHASNDEPVYELTVQDSPLHLVMDSLMWQENLRTPPILLGSHRGFNTNRDQLT
jgi:gentisate 1,2-dioxygenase